MSRHSPPSTSKSPYQDGSPMFGAIMTGAAGYVLKQVRGGDLVGAVRTVAAGGSLLDPRTTGMALGRMRTQAEAKDPLAGLTDQERRSSTSSARA